MYLNLFCIDVSLCSCAGPKLSITVGLCYLKIYGRAILPTLQQLFFLKYFFMEYPACL